MDQIYQIRNLSAHYYSEWFEMFLPSELPTIDNRTAIPTNREITERKEFGFILTEALQR